MSRLEMALCVPDEYAQTYPIRAALELPPPALHQEAAAASVARLALRAEAGLTTWTYGALSVKVNVARLMRAVAEEVERC